MSPPEILVAEDDQNLRRLVALGLRRSGYAVLEAEDGNRALQILADRALGRCDLRGVVMDVRMPGHDGLSILREMTRSLDKLPFVLVTAFGDAQTHRRATDYGAREVLDKPFTLDALCAAAARHFGSPRPHSFSPTPRPIPYAPYDALLLDRYLEIFNRAAGRRRAEPELGSLPRTPQGTVWVRLVGGDDPTTSGFELAWRTSGYERRNTPSTTSGWLTVEIDRGHLEETIAAPWRYYAHPERLALWI
jgi:CheY-like chemotaxis protein